MQNVVYLVLIPILLLNFLAGLVGGGGLIVQGEWLLVVAGIGYGLAAPHLLALAMMPTMVFAPILLRAEERGQIALAVLAGLPAIIWTYLLLGLSCVFVFSKVVAVGDASFWSVLFGYSTAIAPWSYMANQERKMGGDGQAGVLVMFAQFGLIAMMIATWVDPSDLAVSRLGFWFVPFLALGLVAQSFIVWVEYRNRRRYVY